MSELTFKIQSEYGHYTVFINDDFYCTADTLSEAQEEIDNFMINLLESISTIKSEVINCLDFPKTNV